MPDLHGWIVQRIDRVEGDLRGVDKEHGRNWTTRWNASSDTFTIYDDNGSAVAADFLPAVAGLVVAHDPAAVLRRCAADRKILARHTLNTGWYYEPACKGCGTYGDMDLPETDNLNECPELLDLAEAHGLTPEILATLDQPVPPTRPERPESAGSSLLPDGLAEAMYGKLYATFLGVQLLESLEAKAMEILGPELKKISGYVPTTEPEA